MIIMDLLIIPSYPELGIKLLAYDVAKTVFVSQAQISEAIKGFNTVNDPLYNEYLFWRIIAGSLVTLSLIWLGYKVFSFIAPSVQTDLGSKLLVLIIVVGIIWAVCLLYSIATHQGWIWPFQGWIDLIKNAHIIRGYLAQRYASKLNETLNQSIMG